MKYTLSTTYALKWQLKHAPHYKFTADGICINGRTGRIIRKIVNGCKYYSLEEHSWKEIQEIKKALWIGYNYSH